MADSLFDNRYRYDYIYPRGRSGETLRAVDTHQNDLEVVIKRPAPNDAPPIRAGQEVSINNERRALQRLAGHPALTELLDDGQFFVGGMPHQYIVMERAQGQIIGEEVIVLNANGERLPELEILVILDQLLDLLRAAHAQDIVYNDVDAKHLFWNRDSYTLKVIDWGNAVFLEGDEITQQGISRQTDVYQVGELLYYIVTGGRRAEVPRNAAAEFAMDFGDDHRRVHSRLQEIISKALHPNSRLRYATITALRADLSNYRVPIERERNVGVANISNKLKRDDLPMSDLRALRTSIEPLRQQDPGYPPAREAHNIIIDRLRDLAVEADLDAVRIYMLNENWSRSAELLRELREKAGTKTGGLSDLLLDICIILTDSTQPSTPQSVTEAVIHLFDGQYASATLILLADVDDDRQRALQWQIAERISAHMPEVLLLRPNLYRINNALRQIALDGYAVDEPRHLLDEIDKQLDQLQQGSLDLAFLRDSYRAVVDNLTTLNPLLQTFAAQHQLSTRRVPINALERALNASMALADNMHVIDKQATSPREALHALEASRAIDPTTPIWQELQQLLQSLYERLQSSQTYVPAADGSDLAQWLESTRDALEPFQERLSDEMLGNMVKGVERAIDAWRRYQELVLIGNRDSALNALESASRSVKTVSPALSQWFRQLRTVVEGANYIERHSLPGGLGRALADGWQAFDRGRLGDAERLGQQALEIARSESARTAASRLQDMSRLCREWVERNGVASASRSRATLDAVEALFTQSEQQARRDFEAQMPSIETYLKAMSKGLVMTFASTSTAGLRLLFFYYLLQGTLDVHDNLLDDGEFWRDAAIKTLENTGERHIATRTLDEYITRRRDLIEAQHIFSQINGKHALPELVSQHLTLENNAQARLLASGIQSLRDVEIALRAWTDGDFRAGGLKLEEAVRGITEVEKSAQLDLSGYRAWLMDLMEHAATLTVRARDLRALIEQRPDQPDPQIRQTLDQQVNTSERLLGDPYSATLRQWRDTYALFVEIYTADERRSKRLERLDEFFRALFIDQHPLYPLYRHWYGVLEAQSEFAAPDTDDPTPREERAQNIPDALYRASDPLISADVVPPRRRTAGNRRGLWIGGGVLITLLIVAGIGFALFGGDDTPEIALTISATPENEASENVSLILTSTPETTNSVPETTAEISDLSQESTPTLIATITNSAPIITPSATPTQTATVTPTVPTNTPTATATASITPTTPPPTRTPLPEGGVRGQQDLLALFDRSDNLPFNPSAFFGTEGGYQLETDASNPNGVVRIAPPLDFLEDAFGNNAASRITRVEVDISLLTFNPTLLDDEGGVFFSLNLESAVDGNSIGIQINAVNSTTIEVLSNRNGTLTPLRTRSVGSIVVRLRAERDADGNVALFLNDERLVEPTAFLDADAPLLPALIVRDGGVIVRVTNWRVTFR
ncbi:MAG: hypothetical protein ACFE0Q_01900 [Anaerolineae bacterium]